MEPCARDSVCPPLRGAWRAARSRGRPPNDSRSHAETTPEEADTANWATDSPATAALGIARSVIRFTANVIPDADNGYTADTLETMRDEHLAMAAAFHGAHQ
ncbi:hypothetical protein [Streptomyces sp. NBC_00829]|uniref:hypothetical protein n=1 Tax=Streptomyces sp. NBC_00829 TaxID=2903679 RepID=UPI00386B0346|nr:hypothetical protein OG293_00375 [Streptomyces sp. NBC_00829]WTB19045.1 hypothetical protein OG293_39160 [Streptomyces sp. NBC_00829]